MNYYTAKGDGGSTTLFSCQNGMRLSKGDGVFDVLGGCDELNSLLGLCRAITERAGFSHLSADGRSAFLLELRAVQENLFIIQAEIAGAAHRLSFEKVSKAEEGINRFAGRFPLQSSFVIPGATELGAFLDVARTVARRVERIYIRQTQDGGTGNPATAAYLNRLSSLLYVLARTANRAQGADECAPSYA